MQTLLDRITELLELQQQVEADLSARAPGLTPHAAKVVEWLGRHRTGTVRHITVGLGFDESTVRRVVARLIRQGLVRYVDGPPQPGRPADNGPPRGQVELTPAGLRLFDRLRRPVGRNPDA